MKLGDKVAALDEDIEGIISKIEGDQIVIDVDGFDMEFRRQDLILIKGHLMDQNVFSNVDTSKVIAEKEKDDKRFKVLGASTKKQKPAMEVDLHAHQLKSSTKGMNKHQVLNLQLDAARSQLEFAIRKNIQKVVFIHGVGEGVLRMELETLFGRYDNIKFYDADFKKYGFGATEVYVFQNKIE